jgi:glycosyltransferase involved in cell wall biosynthesis
MGTPSFGAMERKFLIVTEKHAPDKDQRDGGAMLVETLKAGLGSATDVLQFGTDAGAAGPWRFSYPDQSPNRFSRRLNNATWVAEIIANLSQAYTDIIFVHVSMLFAVKASQLKGARIWLFPMFMGASYEASGEEVPAAYLEAEKEALLVAQRILTPSHFERCQLRGRYAVPDAKIKVIPRGVRSASSKRGEVPKPGHLQLCSIGSIKPQKNTIGVVELFAVLQKRFPEASLTLIGPAQNLAYQDELRRAIQRLRLSDSIQLTGHVEPAHLPDLLGPMQVHVSASKCETFGRAIFETLRLGLPNLIPQAPCPALEFLQDCPALTTYTDAHQFVRGVERFMTNRDFFAELASEAGESFAEKTLGRLLCAELLGKPALIVSDFDGTIFHKDDPAGTIRSIERFNQQRPSVICSARSLADLRAQVKRLGLTPDWLIGLSGAELSRLDGSIKMSFPMSEDDLSQLRQVHPDGQIIGQTSAPLQWVASSPASPDGFRAETYGGTHYLSKRRTRKLTAILRVIEEMGWDGRVQAFGDGPHDHEFLTYFDGHLIGPNPAHPFLRTAPALS